MQMVVRYTMRANSNNSADKRAIRYEGRTQFGHRLRFVQFRFTDDGRNEQQVEDYKLLMWEPAAS